MSSQPPKLTRPPTRSLKRFGEFIKWVGARPAPRWLFRGQSGTWPLLPTVGRSESNYSLVNETLLLDEFKRSARPLLAFGQPQSDWDWLFVGQHHGLPTRLLDWTTNALVACYFACSGTRSEDDAIVFAARSGEGGYLTRAELTQSPFDIGRTGFVAPTALASRIVTQRGIFSVHHDPPNPHSINDALKSRIDEFRISKDEKSGILRVLHEHGIDAQFLMADLDGLGKTLKWLYDNQVPLR